MMLTVTLVWLLKQVEFSPKPEDGDDPPAVEAQDPTEEAGSKDLAKVVEVRFQGLGIQLTFLRPPTLLPLPPLPKQNYQRWLVLSPQPRPFQVEDEGQDDSPEAPEDDTEVPELPAGADPNKWYRWRQWSISCFIRPSKGSRSLSAGGLPGDGSQTARGGATPSGQSATGSGGSGPPLKEIQQLHLNIETCAVKPDIVLKTPLPEVFVCMHPIVVAFCEPLHLIV